MAYSLDMSKRTPRVAAEPPRRAKRVPEPNPLMESVQQSYDSGEWLVLEAVPTAQTITVTNPITDKDSKKSEADIIQNMLRRAARVLRCGMDISLQPNAKKGHVDVYFHARARRDKKAKGSE